MRRPGDWFSWRWWEQEGLDLSGEREQAVAEADGEDDGSVEEAVREETMGRI